MFENHSFTLVYIVLTFRATFSNPPPPIIFGNSLNIIHDILEKYVFRKCYTRIIENWASLFKESHCHRFC